MTDNRTARNSEFQDHEIKTNIVGKGITRFSFIEPHQMLVSLYRELFRLAINRQKSMATGFQLFSFHLAKRLTIPAIRLSALCKTVLFITRPTIKQIRSVAKVTKVIEQSFGSKYESETKQQRISIEIQSFISNTN
jgi:hypothetical protein